MARTRWRSANLPADRHRVDAPPLSLWRWWVGVELLLGRTHRRVVVLVEPVVDEHVGQVVGTEQQTLRPDTRDDSGVLHDELVGIAPDLLARGLVVLGEGLVDQGVHGG